MNFVFDVMSYSTQDGGSRCCETAWHDIVQENYSRTCVVVGRYWQMMKLYRVNYIQLNEYGALVE
jgi:hypothetical protein